MSKVDPKLSRAVQNSYI